MPESSESNHPSLTPEQVLEQLTVRVADLEDELAAARETIADPRRIRDLPPDVMALAATGAAEEIILAARNVADDVRAAAEADAMKTREAGQQALTLALFEAEGVRLAAELEAEQAVQVATDEGNRIVEAARAAAEAVVERARSALEQAPTHLRVLGLLGLAALPLTYVLFVLTIPGQFLDDAADLSSVSEARVVRMLDKRILDVVGLDVFLAAAVIVAVIAIIRRQWVAGIVVTVGYLAAIASAEALKAFLPRPVLATAAEDLMGAKGGLDTFPSGHATFVTALALAMILLVPLGARLTVAIISIVVVLLVTGALVTAGWHRPSDVVAGVGLALAWMGPVAALMVTRSGVGVGFPKPMWIVPIVGAGVGIVGVGTLVGLMIVMGRNPLDAVAYLGSILVLLGWGLLVVSLFANALRGVDLRRRSAA